MGGVLARELVLNHLDTSLLRGVIFIGSPLKGSTTRQEVKAEIGPPMIAFFNNCFEGIDSQEYTENFYDGFKDSKTSRDVSAAIGFEQMNKKFLEKS